MELPGHMVTLCNHLKKSRTVFQSSGTILHSHQYAEGPEPSSSTSLRVIISFWLWPSECEVVLTVVLICISLVTNDTEHLFLCLLAICVSSFKKCLLNSFCPFLNWVVCWVVRLLYIVWTLNVYQIDALQIFFPILRSIFSVSWKCPLIHNAILFYWY